MGVRRKRSFTAAESAQIWDRWQRGEGLRLIDQPINAASFTAWVEQKLCPTLGPGDIVIMNILSSHKKPVESGALKSATCSAILPAMPGWLSADCEP